MSTSPEQTDSSSAALRVTPAAAAEVRRLLQQEGLPETAGVRIGVRGGGCSGYSYVLNFDRAPAEGDEVIEEAGVRLFCDRQSLPLLAGTLLDYTDGLMGRGFQFKNPNATGTCGCGESFSV